MIGVNPRHEATILNARIRKAYSNKRTKIISLNDVGDLTYPYEALNGEIQTIKDLIEGKNNISKELINAQKPLVILGESLMGSNSASYVFYSIREFLMKNNKITDDWNSFNVLSNDASTVGNYDLNIFKEDINLIEDLKNHKFDIVYLVGQDNLNFEKKSEFIIYQGSHGDKGAEIADVILPGSAYTEQNGYFTNLEGRIQKAYKASYPPGEAKEDWQIINELAEFISNKKLFRDKDELESSMLNFLNLKNENFKDKIFTVPVTFVNENLKILTKNYYFSNVIARASKTMLDCNNSKIKFESTGTDG